MKNRAKLFLQGSFVASLFLIIFHPWKGEMSGVEKRGLKSASQEAV